MVVKATRHLANVFSQVFNNFNCLFPILSIFVAIIIIFGTRYFVQAQTPTPLEQIKITLKPYVEGVTLPVAITNAGDGSGRLFVVEKAGRITIVKDGKVADTPFLDIVPKVESQSSERGLLGLAFHPKFKDNGLFYIYYTALDGIITVARYQVSKNPDVADPASEKVLLTQPHPRVNHNGGQLAFGPDGYLYMGLGDGGGGGDPDNNGQKTNVWLGKLLRLDVDKGDPYGIPDTNPFASAADQGKEVWDYGLRNPWRFSFDRQTGDLYIADVGQNQYEEIDVEKAGSKGGVDYGWDWMEGFHCYEEHPDCDPSKYTQPVFEYNHSQGIAVTGGYVYRGKQFPHLIGTYFFGDFGSGNIWGMQLTPDSKWKTLQLLKGASNISTFGEDENGEIYVTDYGSGKIYQLVDVS